jgi:hypothetical protein
MLTAKLANTNRAKKKRAIAFALAMALEILWFRSLGR